MTTYSYRLSLNDSEIIMLEDALKMMIEKPLTNLFNHMSDKLSRVDLKK